MMSLDIFHWRNSSGRTMALELTQPLTEMSTRNISWGCRRPLRMADNLTIFICRMSWNLGASTFWNPHGLLKRVMGLLYLYFYLDFRFCIVLTQNRTEVKCITATKLLTVSWSTIHSTLGCAQTYNNFQPMCCIISRFPSSDRIRTFTFLPQLPAVHAGRVA
jgi:hypothetical protein